MSKITKLIDIKLKDTVLPIHGSLSAAGYDLYAVSKEVQDNIVTYELNVAIKVPENYVGLLFPRSSIYKTGLLMCNSVGVIDSDFTGFMKAKFYRLGKESPNEYKIGDRVIQLMIVPKVYVKWNQVEELETTERGSGGFGSTGLK